MVQTTPAFRLKPAYAREYLTALVPDSKARRACLHLIAAAIQGASRFSASSWEVTLDRNRLRVNVGWSMVVQLTSNTLVAYVDEQEFRAIPSKDQTAIRRVATVKRWPYRYLPPAVQITIQPSFLNEGIEAHIRRLVFQLAEAAAKKHQVVPNYKAGHSPGVVDYLREELALTDLKQPDWWRGLRPQPTSKLLQRMRIPKSFEYVLEGGKRTVFPAHRHYQIRLVKWLRNQVVKQRDRRQLRRHPLQDRRGIIPG